VAQSPELAGGAGFTFEAASPAATWLPSCNTVTLRESKIAW
jgi:hypothetical protein